MIPKGQRCGKCVYWIQHPDNQDGENATCRRNPPAVRGQGPANSFSHYGIWPVTRKNDWCGDFTAEEKKK